MRYNQNTQYIEKQVANTRNVHKPNGRPRNNCSRRDWWIVKSNNSGCGVVSLESVVLPKEFIGKKVRFKMEIDADYNLNI